MKEEPDAEGLTESLRAITIVNENDATSNDGECVECCEKIAQGWMGLNMRQVVPGIIVTIIEVCVFCSDCPRRRRLFRSRAMLSFLRCRTPVIAHYTTVIKCQ